MLSWCLLMKQHAEAHLLPGPRFRDQPCVVCTGAVADDTEERRHRDSVYMCGRCCAFWHVIWVESFLGTAGVLDDEVGELRNHASKPVENWLVAPAPPFALYAADTTTGTVGVDCKLVTLGGNVEFDCKGPETALVIWVPFPVFPPCASLLRMYSAAPGASHRRHK